MNNSIIKMPSDTGAFLKIRCGNGAVLYGGDQAMFSDERYRKFGCGTISAANLFMYLSACGREGYDLSKKGNFSPSAEEFMALADRINEMTPPDVNGLKLARIYKRLTGERMVYRPLCSMSPKGFFEMMKRSLLGDRPLIISVYNKKGFTIIPYDIENDTFDTARAEPVRAHYMTVTALVTEPRRQVIVSSWGRCFSIDYERYCLENRRILLKGLGNGIGSGVLEVVPSKRK